MIQGGSIQVEGHLPIAVDNIPQELRDQARWVCWALRERGGRPTKVPLTPLRGCQAKSNDPSTWASYDDAIQHAARVAACGIGLVLTGSDYWALDLDHVFNQETGTLVPDAPQFLDEITRSYAERSPSGDGLHVLYRGARPELLRRTRAKPDLVSFEVFVFGIGHGYLFRQDKTLLAHRPGYHLDSLLCRMGRAA